MRCALPVALLLGALAGCNSTVGDESTDSARAALCAADPGDDLFERRIAPLLADDQPSTCNECHLSGVDLSLFRRDTPCETMACLRDRKLVDLKDPESSLILTWIDRADPASPLVTPEVQQKERDAFLDWIKHSSQCQDLECAGVKCGDNGDEPFCEIAAEPTRGQTPDMVDHGGCSDKDLEDLFVGTVYAARGRCFPCHFDNQPLATSEAPRWVSTQLSCENASLETMKNVINRGYVNASDPDHSLIILKPLAESQGGIPHGGHDKFFKGDRSLEHFLYWVRRYAQCKTGWSDAGTPSEEDAGTR